MRTDEAGTFGFYPLEKLGNRAELTSRHGQPAKVLGCVEDAEE